MDKSAANAVCKKWLSKEFSLGKLECREPCGPTYNQSRSVVESQSPRWWEDLYKRSKPSNSECVFSAHWRSPHFECCYDTYLGYLITTGPSAGRSHRYHPDENFGDRRNFDEEEAAYNDCCSDSNSFLCSQFQFLRPVCDSSNWNSSSPSWGKS